MVLVTGYTGVWAFNETNGDIVWHYNDPAVPFETPYTSGNFTELNNVQVKGVPVTILAIDSNGNPQNVGVAESDSSRSYQIAWTPPAEGIYKITASFLGSDSYGDSWAETGLSVDPAPTTTEPPTYPTPPDYPWTIIGAAIAVIIAVAIVGALILMKKH